VDVDARLWPARGPHTDARLRGDARGRNGGFREELAEGVTHKPPSHGYPESWPHLGFGIIDTWLAHATQTTKEPRNAFS
jgi:hypothetical protein